MDIVGHLQRSLFRAAYAHRIIGVLFIRSCGDLHADKALVMAAVSSLDSGLARRG
jgi:hypothetical protein